MYGLSKSYDHTTTAQRAVADVAVQSQHSWAIGISSSAKCCDLLRSLFWCDRKTAIERDYAATASDQTKFKVAEGRSTVTVRCDWGITYFAAQ